MDELNKFSRRFNVPWWGGALILLVSGFIFGRTLAQVVEKLSGSPVM